jgi:predicted XRE-type DNA-binding protein
MTTDHATHRSTGGWKASLAAVLKAHNGTTQDGALFSEEDTKDQQAGSGSGNPTVQRFGEVPTMSKKVGKAAPKGRSVFYDLFPPDVAAEKTMRSELMIVLSDWIAHEKLPQAATAKILGVSAPRVSDLVRQKIELFSLDMLVRFAVRAGLRPHLVLDKAA